MIGTKSVRDGVVRVINKFGYNNDIDTAAAEDMWTVGGIYPYSTFKTPQSLEVIGVDLNDTVLGTGTRTMVVEGLDANLDDKSETVSMNGLTAVVLSGTWLAVNRMYSATTGSEGVNLGNINCQVSGGGQVVSQIAKRLSISALSVGKGQTEQAVLRIPAGYVGIIKKLVATVEDAVATQVAIEIIQVDTDCQTRRTKGSFFVTERTPLDREYKTGGIKFTAGQWAIMRAAEVSSNGVNCSAEFDMELRAV